MNTLRDLRVFDTFFRNLLIEYGLVCLGLFLPLLVLLLVQIVGYSEVIEEIAKGLVVMFVASRLPSHGKRLLWAFIFGLAFGLSESIFYLANGAETIPMTIFGIRLITTVPMHAITAACVMVPMILFKRRRAGLIGIPIAIAIHLLFNNTVALWF